MRIKFCLCMPMIAVILNGCTTLINPPAGTEKSVTVNGQKVSTVLQYSDTRMDTFYPVALKQDGTRARQKFIHCPAPMPDTATQIAAAINANAAQTIGQSGSASSSNQITQPEFSRANSRSGEFDSNVSNSLSGSANYGTTVIKLDGRTELVVASRDIFHNICIMYANGVFDDATASAKFDKALTVVLALADADKAEADAKKAEAEASKETAEQQSAEAEANLAMILAKENQAETARKVDFILNSYIDLAGRLDLSGWKRFITDLRDKRIVSPAWYDAVNRKGANIAEIKSVMNDRYFKNELEAIIVHLGN